MTRSEIETITHRSTETELLLTAVANAHGRHEDDRLSDQLLVATGIVKTYTRGRS
jgi:hypothetical protein